MVEHNLRRLVLYPTELLGHISKIFNFPPPTDSNELPLRRRTLYPGEVRGRVEEAFIFTASADKALLDLGDSRAIQRRDRGIRKQNTCL